MKRTLCVAEVKDGTNTDGDYEYDAFGNMYRDQNKGITSITYNHLNLPKKITFAGNNSITYIYNALGVKLRKEVNEADTQANTHNADYVFNIVHKKNELFSNYIGMISENLGFIVIFV